MTEPPFMMEHTTAYTALEQFKKLEFIMLLYLMNTVAFKGNYTNDILKHWLAMHRSFIKMIFN
jgi:hypothetical protein